MSLSTVVQSLPNDIIEETTNDGEQCVTIVTDAINCSSQVLGERAESTDADDTGSNCSNLIAVFSDMQTLKFKIQLMIAFFDAINHSSGDSQRTMKNGEVPERFAMMIDSSKKRMNKNLWLRIEFQSSHITENHNNIAYGVQFLNPQGSYPKISFVIFY